jgi:A/G-specific adenine glycosylase
VCTPKKPKCEECPLNEACVSFATNEMLNYPVKIKKVKQRVRYFNYLVISENDTFYIEQRIGKGIWENMFQFPLIETDKDMEEWANEIEGLILENVTLPVKHILSHQKVFAKFWEFRIDQKSFTSLPDWKSVSVEDIEHKPVPKLIDNYISKRFH